MCAKKLKESAAEPSECYKKLEPSEVDLLNRIDTIRAEIHSAICDSIDTRAVVEKISQLIGLINVYLKESEQQKAEPNCNLLANTANYLIRLLRIMGVETGIKEFDFSAQQQQSGDGNIEDRETSVMPFLEAMANFREVVRNEAKAQKNVNILKECDRLRDNILPELGVRLEDHTTNTCVKLVDPEVLKREREQKEAVEKEKAERKKQQELEKEARRAAKEEAKRKQREKQQNKEKS